MTADQPPAGFIYAPDLVTESEEHSLVERMRAIDFTKVEMRGQIARRRTAHFGWVYGYESWRIEPGPPIPDFGLAPPRWRVSRPSHSWRC